MTKRILVVEDQEDNRRIMRDLLTSAGYELIEATDGEAGVRLADEQRPDLILMDIQLPVLDGYEATRRIKQDPELRHIPIIVVTSYALSGDEAQGDGGGLRRLCRQAVQPAPAARDDPQVPARDRAGRCASHARAAAHPGGRRQPGQPRDPGGPARAAGLRGGDGQGRRRRR